MKTYHVFQSDEGCGEVYLGTAPSLRAARKLVAAYVRGEKTGLPECDYETARHVVAMPGPPPKTGDAVAWWRGRDGSNYCACEQEAQ